MQYHSLTCTDPSIRYCNVGDAEAALSAAGKENNDVKGNCMVGAVNVDPTIFVRTHARLPRVVGLKASQGFCTITAVR